MYTNPFRCAWRTYHVADRFGFEVCGPTPHVVASSCVWPVSTLRTQSQPLCEGCKATEHHCVHSLDLKQMAHDMYEKHRSHQTKCYDLEQREGKWVWGNPRLEDCLCFQPDLCCLFFSALCFCAGYQVGPTLQVSGFKNNHHVVGELWVGRVVQSVTRCVQASEVNWWTDYWVEDRSMSPLND